MGRIVEKLTYKGRKKRLLADTLFVGAHIILCAAAYIYIKKINILPDRYLRLVALGMIGSVLLVCLLNMFKYVHVIGKIISVVACVAMIVGLYYGHNTMKMLNNISTDNYDVDTYIVVALKESSVNELKGLAGKTVGVVSSMNNRETVAKAVEELEKKSGCEITTKEYSGMGQLIKALMSGEVDAVLYNAALDDTIKEAIDYYENAVKIIDNVEIKTKIEEKPVAEEPTQENITPDPVPSGNEEQESQSVTEPVTYNDDLSNTGYVYDPSRDPKSPGGGGYIGGDNTVDNTSKGPITGRSFNILISGIDAYGSLAGRSRSDVNILVSVNPVTKQIVLTNTPRDYYVPIPGITPGNWRDKLTHAGIYGVWSSAAAVENIYNVNIDYYVRVNFTSFVTILNAIGEITVHSDYEFSAGGYHFVQGDNVIKTGSQGLAFARERYNVPGGDHQRGRDQMALIEAMLNKCMSPAILPNFIDIVNSVSNCVQTNMTMDEITSMVRMQLNDGASWNIRRQWVSGSGATRECYSMIGWDLSVVLPDQSSINSCRNVINSVLN